ncbi:MAG: hypothetical protein HAW63_02320 [Bdellovibrionaceae bacterium]|nr:hypothetical protein [Pseudobdellovibrionaceae bacterium]
MHFFSQLPKNILVAIVLVGGVFFIMYAQPPVTICQSVKDSFVKSQKGFLYIRKEANSFKKESLYQKLYKLCKSRKSPGSCYQLFYNTKSLLLSLNSDGISCIPTIPKLKGFLQNNIKLMAEIAWGPAPPSSKGPKFSWLQESDFYLFCNLLGTYKKALGEEQKNHLINQTLIALPGYEVVDALKARQLSLFSINCNKY